MSLPDVSSLRIQLVWDLCNLQVGYNQNNAATPGSSPFWSEQVLPAAATAASETPITHLLATTPFVVDRTCGITDCLRLAVACDTHIESLDKR